MANKILEVKDVKARVEDNEILHGLNLTINEGETHVIMGPNGAGKSTLGNVLMGNPKYEKISGQIFFNGEDITEAGTDEIAKKGMFLSFIWQES